MASIQPKILVFGATGNVGKEVSSALIRRNVPFRAIAHTASKAESLKNQGRGLVEIVEADLHNADSVTKAAEGIEVAFLMTPPGQTFLNSSIGDILKKAGVKRVVKLSGLGSEQFHWTQEHRDAEKHFTEIGLPFTSLRPSSFHSNWFRDISSIKGQNLFRNGVRDARVNHISNYDIGEAAAITLTTSGHEGKAYDLTGPDTITYHEAVAILSEAVGRKITYVPLSDEEVRKTAASFLPPAFVDGYVNMYQYFAAGGYDQHHDDLEKLTGTKGRSLKEFFTANAAAFQ